MNETRALVLKATSHSATLAEKHGAFGELVGRFQDMAYACAYAVLGDTVSAAAAATGRSLGSVSLDHTITSIAVAGDSRILTCPPNTRSADEFGTASSPR